MNANQALAALEAAIESATSAERPGLVVALSARLAALGAGLAQVPQAPPSEATDRNLDVPTIAERMGVSVKYVGLWRQPCCRVVTVFPRLRA